MRPGRPFDALARRMPPPAWMRPQYAVYGPLFGEEREAAQRELEAADDAFTDALLRDLAEETRLLRAARAAAAAVLEAELPEADGFALPHELQAEEEAEAALDAAADLAAIEAAGG